MQLKCPYCGTTYDETLESCPNCGAINSKVNRTADKVPQTIDELREFCTYKNLPLDKLRFFIGQDCREPKAYGIYKNGDKFIVYKNKSDGTRAIRYEGTDEAYAVNEIYQKLHSEVVNYKDFEVEKRSRGESYSPYKPENSKKDTYDPNHQYPRNIEWYPIAAILIVVGLIIGIFVISFKAISWTIGEIQINNVGYYEQDVCTYYHSDRDNWYMWDAGARDWTNKGITSDTIEELRKSKNKCYTGTTCSSYLSPWEDSEFAIIEKKQLASELLENGRYIKDYYNFDGSYYYYSNYSNWYLWDEDIFDWDYIEDTSEIDSLSNIDYCTKNVDIESLNIEKFEDSDAYVEELNKYAPKKRNNSNYSNYYYDDDDYYYGSDYNSYNSYYDDSDYDYFDSYYDDDDDDYGSSSWWDDDDSDYSSWDSDWDSDWDNDWSSWDSDYSSDWDSDW